MHILDATTRIHNVLSQIELDRRTSYSLGQSEGMGGAVRVQIRVHNSFLYNPIRPHYTASHEVRRELRRQVVEAARPFDVGFYGDK